MDNDGEPLITEVKEGEAPMKPRRCTDVACLFILAAAFGALGYITHYSNEHGDMRRLTHGFDFTGELCGADVPERPYVYYCQRPLALGQLDLAHPVCVPSCPVSNATATPCYEGHTTTVRETDARTKSFDMVYTYTFANVQDYPSQALAGMYCTPQDTTMYKQMWAMLTNTTETRFVLEAWEVRHAWAAILSSAGLAVVMSYVYLVLVRFFAKPLVYGVLLAIVLGVLSVGVLLVGMFHGFIDAAAVQGHASSAGFGDSFLMPDDMTGGSEMDMYLGYGCLATGLALSVLACCCVSQVEKAIDCIEVTIDCLMRLPQLLLMPLSTLAAQLATFFAMLYGFLHLLSVGEVSHKTLAELATTPVDIAGVARTLAFKEHEVYFIIFYAFMIFWMLELVAALSQFMVIYAVQVWYFESKEGATGRSFLRSMLTCGSLCTGMRYGMTYHLGSLAFGSCIIAVLRTIRAVLDFVTSQSKGGNPVAENAAKVCSCCLACFERFLKFLNKNAYMDVSLSSSSFCAAAKKALKILTSNLPAVALLNGMTWVVQVVGVLGVTMGCMGVTHLAVHNLGVFSDPESHHYVAKPLDLCLVVGVVCASISGVFMVLLSTVSDTILFCLVVEKDAGYSGSGGLDSLKDKVDKHSASEC